MESDVFVEIYYRNIPHENTVPFGIALLSIRPTSQKCMIGMNLENRYFSTNFKCVSLKINFFNKTSKTHSLASNGAKDQFLD